MPTFTRQSKNKSGSNTGKKHFFKRPSMSVALPKHKPVTPEDLPPTIKVAPEAIAPDVLPEPETQIAEISRMIKTNSFDLKNEISDRTPKSDTNLFVDTPEAFNGVSDDEEKFKLVDDQLLAEQRKSRKLEHEMSLLKAEFKDEKQKMEQLIRELKQELHRTVPLQDNKFFSLSKEIREAMDEIKAISTPITLPNVVPVPSVTPVIPPVPTPTANLSTPEPKQVVNPTVAAPPAQKPELPLKKNRNKRLFLSIITVIVIIGLIAAFTGINYLAKPKVDQKLVEQYLNKKDGSVAGAQTGTSDQNAPPSVNEVLPQDEIPYENVQWESFTEPLIGIQLLYPKNAVRVNKTDSSVTFLRKTGYLLKIQQIETALNLKAYWEQIKATTKSYEVEETTFHNDPALHLTLTDQDDYPGNRYLVKKGKFIFDVWYAEKSEKFSENDLKMVQKMLESLVLSV